MWQQGTVETYAKVFQNGTTASEKWVDDDGGCIHPPPTLRLEVGVFCYGMIKETLYGKIKKYMFYYRNNIVDNSNLATNDNTKTKTGPIYIIDEFFLNEFGDRLFIMRNGNTFDLRFERNDITSVLATFKNEETAISFIDIMRNLIPEE